MPRKNLAPLQGKPLLVYTVEAALRSAGFTRVVVSTEDAEIAGVARGCGAIVDERPSALASDAARVLDVCLELLDREEKAGRSYDVLGCLYPTAPLRDETDIARVLGLLEPGRCDFAMAVTHYDKPPHQALRREPDGELRPFWPDLVERRSQEVGELLVDNGSTYAVSVPAFRAHRTFYGPGLRGHVMPRERSVDVDVAEDLDVLRFYASRVLPVGSAS